MSFVDNGNKNLNPNAKDSGGKLPDLGPQIPKEMPPGRPDGLTIEAAPPEPYEPREAPEPQERPEIERDDREIELGD